MTCSREGSSARRTKRTTSSNAARKSSSRTVSSVLVRRAHDSTRARPPVRLRRTGRTRSAPPNRCFRCLAALPGDHRSKIRHSGRGRVLHRRDLPEMPCKNHSPQHQSSNEQRSNRLAFGHEQRIAGTRCDREPRGDDPEAELGAGPTSTPQTCHTPPAEQPTAWRRLATWGRSGPRGEDRGRRGKSGNLVTREVTGNITGHLVMGRQRGGLDEIQAGSTRTASSFSDATSAVRRSHSATTAGAAMSPRQRVQQRPFDRRHLRDHPPRERQSVPGERQPVREQRIRPIHTQAGTSRCGRRSEEVFPDVDFGSWKRPSSSTATYGRSPAPTCPARRPIAQCAHASALDDRTGSNQSPGRLRPIHDETNAVVTSCPRSGRSSWSDTPPTVRAGTTFATYAPSLVCCATSPGNQPAPCQT